MKLIIVESPNKTKKIKEFLGEGYEVMASVGHIRDMPENSMGVEAPNFKPEYVSTTQAKKRIALLKAKAAIAEVVYLATDPDREGEAIAWHLLDVLKPKKHYRVKFNSITKNAVIDALNNPGAIDMALVHAQEGRRVLDRLVGFNVSPLLKSMANSPFPLSAGRVQTPATLMVVEREEAIANFKPMAHFKLKAHFPWPGRNDTWSASWSHRALQKALGIEESEYFTDQAFVNQLAQAIVQQPIFMIVQADGKEVSRKPPAPFSTSTLQQVANTKLGFGVDATMKAAQALFEAGLITYHRTDSTNLEAESAEEIRAWLKSKNLPIPDKQHRWDSKDGAQEAHEAIRPTYISNQTPPELEPASEPGMLYKLIWERTVACQMESAKYFAMSVVMASALKVQEQNLQFVARGRTLLSPGWLALTPEEDGVDSEGNDKQEDDAASENALPSLNKGERINCVKGEPISATTKAPPRLTIATLVRDLEAYSIGRPSTYASIIGNLLKRNYIEERGRKIYATAIGKAVIAILKGRFSFAQLGFTKVMEGALDKIAAGQTTYLKVVTYQYEILMGEIAAVTNDPSVAKDAQSSMQETLGEQVTCPVCSKGVMQRRKGVSSYFWSCSGYPDDCRAKGDDLVVKGKPPAPDMATIRVVEGIKPVVSDVDCPVCNKHKLAKRNGRNGVFWSCTNFKKCKGRASDIDGRPDL